MDTLAEIRVAVKNDLNAAGNSALFPSAVIDAAIIRAYQTITGIFRWPQLQDAKYTTTQTNIEYYDAPTGWRPQSMWRLDINGVRFGEVPDGSPLNFEDYLLWKEDHPSSTDKRWAVQWLRYFISPTPTNNTDVITIWGQKNAPAIAVGDDNATTIFSVNMPECNEALALEAVAILKTGKAEQPNSGQLMSQKANIIFTAVFTKWAKDTAKQEKIQPMLNVPDFFARGGSTKNSLIGRFDYDAGN